MARRHAKAAYHVALTRFSLATMVATYAGIYERALATAGFPVSPVAGGSDEANNPVPASPLRSVSNS